MASTAVSLKKETALYLKKDKLVPDRCIHSVLRLKNLSVRLSCAVSRSRCRILFAVSKCSRQASLVQRCCEPKFCTQQAAGEPSTKLKARSRKLEKMAIFFCLKIGRNENFIMQIAYGDKKLFYNSFYLLLKNLTS